METEKRLIDANGLIGWLIKAGRYCKGLENSKPITKAIGTIINYVQGMQTVDAVEVVRGRWEWRGGIPRCSNCGEMPPGYSYDGVVNTTPYCPNCGAKMDGGRKCDG